MKRTTPVRLATVLILLAGCALRLVRLGAESLWYDETVSVYLAGSTVPDLIRHTAGDIHPPGYYLLLRAWLTFMGYPTGHADPTGNGLEFSAAFFSLAFGLLLICLVYCLARRLIGKRGGMLAAALVSASPFHIWYGQEVRMYTLGAALGALALFSLLRALAPSPAAPQGRAQWCWWAAYAASAAAGLYTLYYFAFLLVALNLWVALMVVGLSLRSTSLPKLWAAGNLVAAAAYAPWLPLAVKQAVSPPVPAWRTIVAWPAALKESLSALVLGQSGPDWLWPLALLAAMLALVGWWAVAAARIPPGGAPGSDLPDRMRRRRTAIQAAALPLASAGSWALMLLASSVTPLYHVRYVFIYSSAFYVALAAGLIWLGRRRRSLAAVAMAVWLAGSGISLRSFWLDSRFRPDNHRAAVAFLEGQWRPGDVVLANAGYAYTALVTYWPGPIAWLGRLTSDFREPRSDEGLVLVIGGEVDGSDSLGWADARSDFYPISQTDLRARLTDLAGAFPRLWHYRIYDTVSDPSGAIRRFLDTDRQMVVDRLFQGEANLRVQGFVPRSGSDPAAALLRGSAAGFDLAAEILTQVARPGERAFANAFWRTGSTPIPLATSLRLLDAAGTLWSQPPDEQPLGPLYRSQQWAPGSWQRQPLALPVLTGTPPGSYEVVLVAYDPLSLAPYSFESLPGGPRPLAVGVSLGVLQVERPVSPPPGLPALRILGPLALVEAVSPAGQVRAGDSIPVDLLWQARAAPVGALVVVVQLLDRQGQVVAGLEEQPVQGRYPAEKWQIGELVRDRHQLSIPEGVNPGQYQLVIGLYGAANGVRFTDRGVDHFTLKRISVNR